MLAGVAGGLADYLGMDPSLVRLVWALLFLAGGFGFLLYIVAWIVDPGGARVRVGRPHDRALERTDGDQLPGQGPPLDAAREPDTADSPADCPVSGKPIAGRDGRPGARGPVTAGRRRSSSAGS